MHTSLTSKTFKRALGVAIETKKVQGIRCQNATVAEALAVACEAMVCAPNLGCLDIVEFECLLVKFWFDY